MLHFKLVAVQRVSVIVFGHSMSLFIALFPFLLTGAAHALLRGPGGMKHFGDVSNVSQDLLFRCQVHYFETYLDHFSRVRHCAIIAGSCNDCMPIDA